MQYRKRGNPVEVEEIPQDAKYRVNDGGIISYHTDVTFSMIYEKIEPEKAASGTVPNTFTSTSGAEWIVTQPTPAPIVPAKAEPEIPTKPQKPGDRPGFEYDPFLYETGENFVVSRIIAWIILRATGQVMESQGFCSTVREWHIMWKGAWAGFKSAQLGDVPDCPPLWADESQYYEGAAMVFNVGKIMATSGVATFAGTLYALGITPADILKAISTLGGT